MSQRDRPCDFTQIRTWVFDLDNTLYPPHFRLFDQIDARMTAWISAHLRLPQTDADSLRQRYWRDYGTTLAGLMRWHQVDPAAFLADVHDICLAHMHPDAALRAEIDNLEGLKIVYTNGSAHYGRRVLEARGLLDAFDHVYGIEDANLLPKPDRQAFETVFSHAGFDLQSAAMFEDDPRNLIAPHAMGMRTVHVADAPTEDDAHIHHHTNDLCDFLAGLGAGRGS